MRILTVVGARPQFIKAAMVSRAIAKARAAGADIHERIVHTGQHYDANMSDVFFRELELPVPDVNLEVGSGPHGRQTGAMLERIESILLDAPPDLVLVYGDTNSTLAGALAAAKLHVPVAHVEAGLRSFNRRMPEEINRVLADHVASWLLCPTRTAVQNLANEGVTAGVHLVGDVMFDSVLLFAQLARQRSRILQDLALQPLAYYLVTVHRAENTDDPLRMEGILAGLRQLDAPVVLPVHPRLRARLGAELSARLGPVRAIEPVGYLDMLTLQSNARVILTDSGGVQKEAYFLKRPCVTLRDETEWVETVEAGWNRLAGADAARIIRGVQMALQELPGLLGRPETLGLFGQGDAADRIVRMLLRPREACGAPGGQ